MDNEVQSSAGSLKLNDDKTSSNYQNSDGSSADDVSRQAHARSDMDSAPDAQHHTLGYGPNQAAAGTSGYQPGDIITSAAKTRAGAVLCDGRTVSRAAQPALFNAIGTTFNVGNVASDSFMVPNLQGRTPVGAGTATGAAGATAKVLGGSGGEEAHQLTTNEMPSHSHVQTGRFLSGASAHSHASGGGGAAEAPNPSTGVATGMGSTAGTGNDAFHNNMQPYVVMNYFIKT